MEETRAAAHLFSHPRPIRGTPINRTEHAVRAQDGGTVGAGGASNPPFRASATSSAAEVCTCCFTQVLTIADEAGKQVRRLDLDKSAGLRRVAWNLRTDPPPPQDQGGRGRTGEPGVAGAAPIGGGRGQQPPLVPAGRYHATLGLMKGPDVTPTGSPRAFQVVPLER